MQLLLPPLIQAGKIKGAAHITGGGFLENIPRMLPPTLGADIQLDAWRPRPIFGLLETLGGARAQRDV